MSAPAQGVIVVLAAAAPTIGQVVPSGGNTWQLGVGKMLAAPDTMIVAYDVGGGTPDSRWLLDYPSVQVMVRGKPQGYQAAMQKMEDVTDVLLGMVPRTVLGDRWDGVTILASGSFIGNDDKDRPQFSATFRLIVEPAPSVYTNRSPL